MIQPSSRSCSTAASTTSATRAAGITTAPSPSATITSLGITATPPQPIASCQPTKVRPFTDAGAAAPWHHTGSVVPRTPARSRITPSLTSAATPRLCILAHRMSPKMPASLVPIASTTAIEPAGIASIAARVEIGEPHDAGVARSSRAGTKRSVKARPTRRSGNGVASGRAPRIQTLRRPFLSSTVVSVAVVTPSRVCRIAASRGWTSIGVMGNAVSVVTRNRTVVRRLAIAQVEDELVDETPAPAFGRVVALDDRVRGGVEVLGRVTVLRIVAAADVAAGAADAQVDPGVA